MKDSSNECLIISGEQRYFSQDRTKDSGLPSLPGHSTLRCPCLLKAAWRPAEKENNAQK